MIVARRLLLAPALLVGLAAAAPVRSADDPRAGFVAHRAVYEMSLDQTTERAEIASVSGRLVYEFTGSTCDGFDTRLRLVTRMGGREGESRLVDRRSSSHEDGAGTSFDFLTESFVDGRRTENAKGSARRDGDAVRLRLDRPAPKSVDLPGRLRFPTEHMAEIVAAARAGRTILDIDFFEGADDGEKVWRTTVVIGAEQTGPDDTAEEPAAVSDLLKGHRRWPVTVSFFDPAKPAEGEEVPDQLLGFVLYDNAVSRRLRFDYGSFSAKGTLSSLEPLPAAPCR
ncbi:MAG: cell envelope integrity EipB family protein [Siculibacillus sp.]